MAKQQGEWKAHKNALGTWTISTDLEHIGQIDRHFNANFIVKAVNCHDDLYEALKAMLKDYSSNPLDADFFDACLMARQALSNAEGK